MAQNKINPNKLEFDRLAGEVLGVGLSRPDLGVANTIKVLGLLSEILQDLTQRLSILTAAIDTFNRDSGKLYMGLNQLTLCIVVCTIANTFVITAQSLFQLIGKK